jgi:hypothetical protein
MTRGGRQEISLGDSGFWIATRGLILSTGDLMNPSGAKEQKWYGHLPKHSQFTIAKARNNRIDRTFKLRIQIPYPAEEGSVEHQASQ